VTITVDDDNGGSAEIAVTISVTDVNENRAPVFSDGVSTTRSVAENTSSGVNIDTPVSAEIVVTISVTDVDENRAPVFTDGDSTTREVAENTASGVNIGTAVGATDADDDTLTYSLGGDDAESFSINTSNGQLRTHAALDFETKSSYSVTITVDDNNGGSAEIAVTISVTDVNENRAHRYLPMEIAPPEKLRRIRHPVSTSALPLVPRMRTMNPCSAMVIARPAKCTLTYSLGGDDAESFSINTSNGQLRQRIRRQGKISALLCPLRMQITIT
jgi:hypothetical protein